jgi:hypothetical protein
MLRHIISVGLAMTACVALMPTKAKAATLTIIPSGEIQKNPGDLIEFSFVFTPDPGSVVTFRSAGFSRDPNELSPALGGGFTFPINGLINNETTVLRRTFTVLTPFKDGIRDLTGAVVYRESSPTEIIISASGADVVPVVAVPEPLTIFGTAIGLGCGVLFKQKSSKKAVSRARYRGYKL